MNPLIYAALLFAGVAAGVFTHGRVAPYFGPVTLVVFLPALIFEAVWGLDAHVVRANWRPIALLAVPGVIVTAGIIAAISHWAGLPWPAALLLGAILSATDPIAVVAIFRQMQVPPALATIVESESLFNDAAAVVLYRALLAGAALTAGLGVVAGIALGAATAWAASFALRRSVSAPLQSAATLLGAYAVYLLSEHFAWSGILAVISFGIVLRELERHILSVECAVSVGVFWSRVALVANAALFFLLGASADFSSMAGALPVIGATLGAVLLARIVLAYGLLQFAGKAMTRAWMAVVSMAGIRGALAVALALATPAAIAQRSVVIDATFAVAVLTILIGALTLRGRMERLQL